MLTVPAVFLAIPVRTSICQEDPGLLLLRQSVPLQQRPGLRAVPEVVRHGSSGALRQPLALFEARGRSLDLSAHQPLRRRPRGAQSQLLRGCRATTFLAFCMPVRASRQPGQVESYFLARPG